MMRERGRALAGSAFGRYRVVDIDTHVTEPADVWTSRVSRKWGERVPHVKRMEKTDVWFIGDRAVHAPGPTARECPDRLTRVCIADVDSFVGSQVRVLEGCISLRSWHKACGLEQVRYPPRLFSRRARRTLPAMTGGEVMPGGSIDEQITGGVCLLRLNRPEKKNALSNAMWRELLEAMRRARASDEVRVVVVTGAGGNFSAGTDLGDMNGSGPERSAARERHSSHLLMDLLCEFDKPLIAAADGVGVGFGTLLARSRGLLDRVVDQFGIDDPEQRREQISRLTGAS